MFGQRRRQFLGAIGAAGAAALAGCGGLLDGDSTPGTATAADYDAGDAAINMNSLSNYRGSGVFSEGRPAPGGTSMRDLPNLSGELNIYLGAGEGGAYGQLFDIIAEIYPDFSYTTNALGSADAVNRIRNEYESDQVSGDVYVAVDAGSLGQVADSGAALSLNSSTTESVPDSYVGPNRQWVGFEGRARSIPYNTDEFDESDIPDSVADFPNTDAFAGNIGWAPTYSAFQSFVTAMIQQRGEDEARGWLEGIQNLDVTQYPDEFQLSGAVADGEQYVGFANHYYALRVLNSRPDAPLDLAFTSGDAGALVNVSGAAALANSGNSGLADAFVRHLLSAEAQEFFATVTYGYPMIPDVSPVGGLPSIDELDSPDIDLTELADKEDTLALMRDVGVL